MGIQLSSELMKVKVVEGEGHHPLHDMPIETVQL